MSLKTMLVDDDLMARKAIQHLCKKVPEIDLAHICESAEEAIERLEKAPVDLLLLDVEMPGLSGIELLENIPSIPYVIFITGKQEYAFDAFQFEAVDYLQKPITLTRFKVAVNKVVQLQAQERETEETADDLFVKVDGRYVRVQISDILFFENAGDYVRIKTEKDSLIIYSTLKNIEQKLVNKHFFKVHRSYIINLDKIVDIEDSSLIIDKEIIPISRYKKNELMQLLNLL